MIETNYKPTLIYNLNPSKFGGHQDDYTEKSILIIKETLALIRSAKANHQCLNKLFFSILDKLGNDRARLAKAHGSQDAEEFGLRRDIFSNLDTLTNLEAEYESCNIKILNMIEKIVGRVTSENFTQKKKIIQNEMLGRKSSIEVELFDIKKSKLSFEDLMPDLPKEFELYKKTSKRPTELLKKNHPEFYKRMRLVSAVNHTESNLTDKNIGFLKDFLVPAGPIYASVNVRLEINGKMYSMSQYILWLYRGELKSSDLDVMKMYSKVTIIHQDIFLIKDSLKDLAGLFERILLCPSSNRLDLKNLMALFRFEFAQAMPFARGSAAVSEWLELAIYNYHGIDVSYDDNKLVDLEVFANPLLSDFVAEYNNIVTFLN